MPYSSFPPSAETAGPDAPFNLQPGSVDTRLQVSDTLFLRGLSPRVLPEPAIDDLLYLGIPLIVAKLIEQRQNVELSDSNISSNLGNSLITNYTPASIVPKHIDLSERNQQGSGCIRVFYASPRHALFALQALSSLQFQGYFGSSGAMMGFELGEVQKKKVQYNPVLRRVGPVGKKVTALETVREWMEGRGEKIPAGNKEALTDERDAAAAAADGDESDSEEDKEADLVINESDNTIANPGRTNKKKQIRKLRLAVEAEKRKIENTEGPDAESLKSAEAIERHLIETFGKEDYELAMSWGGSKREEIKKIEEEEGVDERRRREKEEKELEKEVFEFRTPDISSSTSIASRKVRFPEAEVEPQTATKVPKIKPPKHAKLVTKTDELVDNDLFKWGWIPVDGAPAEVDEEDVGEDTETKELMKFAEEVLTKAQEEQDAAAANSKAAASTVTDSSKEVNESGFSGGGVQLFHSMDTAAGETRTKLKTTKAGRNALKKKMKEEGKEPTKSSTALVRRNQKNPTVCLRQVDDLQYQQKCIVANRKTAYPCPSGVYLTRVVKKLQKEMMEKMVNPSISKLNRVSLLPLLADVESHGGLKSYDKEISESIACVDAVERAIRLCTGVNPEVLTDVNVFVVGDGKNPLTAACVREFLPYNREREGQEDGWRFFSIDPLMQEEYYKAYTWASNAGDSESESDSKSAPKPADVWVYKAYSQDFKIDEEVKKAGGRNWEHYKDVGVVKDGQALECEEIPVTGATKAKSPSKPTISLGKSVFESSKTKPSEKEPGTPQSTGELLEEFSSDLSDGSETISDSEESKSPISDSNPAESEALFDNDDSHLIKAPENLSIVVACHSHAPLKEFWRRVPAPRLAITLPCCENFSDLGRKPTFQYDDFEIFTPKRRVRIYGDV